MGSRGSGFEDEGKKSKVLDKKELTKQIRSLRDEFEEAKDVIYDAFGFNKYDKYLTTQAAGITKVNGIEKSQLFRTYDITEKEMAKNIKTAEDYLNRLKKAREKYTPGKEINYRKKAVLTPNGKAKVEYSKGRVVKVYHDNFLFGGSPFVRVEYDVDFGNGKKDKFYENIRLDEIESMNK